MKERFMHYLFSRYIKIYCGVKYDATSFYNFVVFSSSTLFFDIQIYKIYKKNSISVANRTIIAASAAAVVGVVSGYPVWFFLSFFL